MFEREPRFSVDEDELHYDRGGIFPRNLRDEAMSCYTGHPNLWGLTRFPLMSESGEGWYTQSLAPLGLERLDASAGTTSFRFILIPSFGGTVAVTVFETPEGNNISAVGRVYANESWSTQQMERQLTPAEWQGLSDLVHQSAVLDEPARLCSELTGADGERWIIEAQQDGRYHFIDHWSVPEGPVHEVGRYLLRLTGWEAGEAY